VWKKDGLNEKRKKGENKKIILIKKPSHFSQISLTLKLQLAVGCVISRPLSYIASVSTPLHIHIIALVSSPLLHLSGLCKVQPPTLLVGGCSSHLQLMPFNFTSGDVTQLSATVRRHVLHTAKKNRR
jgi:hypothetical protein